MKTFFVSTLAFLLALGSLPLPASAHTTVIFPEVGDDGTMNLMVVHFEPWHGSRIMGIRLHEKDTPSVKGLESIFLIHDGKRTDISEKAIPERFRGREGSGECYRIPMDSLSRAGDYIFVIKHQPHWKSHLGFYICKISKFFLNNGGLVTDWPNRVLEDAPEIIPLTQPFSVYKGALFRAQVVDDKGKSIPHARIHVEFLNYKTTAKGIQGDAPILENRDMGDFFMFSDNCGAFSFIPPSAGIWTFTLVDGDDHLSINGKKLRYDSSISIAVKPVPGQ